MLALQSPCRGFGWLAAPICRVADILLALCPTTACLIPAALQLTALTNLRSLTLHTVHFGDDAPLAALSGTLRRLAVRGCNGWLPRCLSTLTSLQELTIDDPNAATDDSSPMPCCRRSGRGLEAALPAMQQLTKLELSTAPGLDAPPAALASLTRLHTLMFQPGWYLPESKQAALPGGQWLASLRRVLVPAGVLERSAAVLAAAPDLLRDPLPCNNRRCNCSLCSGSPGAAPPNAAGGSGDDDNK